MSWIPWIAIALLLAWGMSGYNRLVALQERFRNAFAQIDVQLKRRYDLIPNLVETARAFLSHERETLEAVIQARNAAMAADRVAAAQPGAPSAMLGLVAAEQTLSGTLGRFFGLAEAYPELRSNQNMLQLQEELASTENRIAFARQHYNDAVMQYNALRAQVPTNLLANAFRFQRAEFFELEAEGERAVPRLDF
jgi:LemA protein